MGGIGISEGIWRYIFMRVQVRVFENKIPSEIIYGDEKR